jgi:hypothetical protein
MAMKNAVTRFKVILNSKSTTLRSGKFGGIAFVQQVWAASDILFMTVEGDDAELEKQVSGRSDLFGELFKEPSDYPTLP